MKNSIFPVVEIEINLIFDSSTIFDNKAAANKCNSI